MQIKKQVRRLLALEFVGNFKPAGALWVLLLVGRGFSLAQVGLAEGFFHLVSLCCEVPSGMVADTLGRRRTLMASHLAFALSAGLMIVSRGMAGVLAAMALNALAYNLASGTREAITYESLLQVGREGDYLRLSSRQNIFWRLAAAAATLCAGGVVLLGYRRGYALDLVLSLACIGLAGGLVEPLVTESPRGRGRLGDLARLLGQCAGEAARFLRRHPRVCLLMLFNAVIGAVATLMRFFLQDGLTRAGASPVLLGPLLLCIELGGVVGSWLAPVLGKLPYRAAGTLCALGQGLALLLVSTGRLPALAVGGILAVACDDSLQVLTDARLNANLPSEQRATLISVSSMCFSLVMIVCSPLAGALI